MISLSAEFDYNTVRQAVRGIYPHLFISNLRKMRGTQNLTYLVNDTCIVRFFKNARLEQNIVNQKKMLDFLATKISYSIPRFDIHMVYVNKTPQVVAAGPKIEGKRLSRHQFSNLNSSDKERIFTHLSSFLGELHSIERNNIKDIPVLSHTEMFLNLLPPMPRVVQKVFQKTIDAMFSPRCLCHYDLNAGNYLIDKNKNVCGILDFDTLCWGNPIWDIGLGFFYSKKDLNMFRACYEKETKSSLPHFSSAVLIRKLLLLSFLSANKMGQKLKSQKPCVLFKKEGVPMSTILLPHERT